ncbi:hypothetical protein NX009_10515 [Klebsiella pneumoniae]|nr:hypothetical protein [Klebsiella pneumoniae]
MGKIRRTGDIQHPGDASVRSLERHRRAVQILVAGKKVLTAIDLAAIVNRQRGADGVGPAPAFTPQIAGSQRHALGLLQRLGIAEYAAPGRRGRKGSPPTAGLRPGATGLPP